MWQGEACDEIDVAANVLENGYNFNLPGGNKAKSHTIVLSGHFDTPAKDGVLCKIHHNGYYGCSFCEEKGIMVKAGKGHTHI